MRTFVRRPFFSPNPYNCFLRQQKALDICIERKEKDKKRETTPGDS
jgi:hypothetical protein